MDIEERYELAWQKYFDANPARAAEIETFDHAALVAVGMDVDAFREHRKMEVFAVAAKERGLEPDEYVIQLIAESPAQAHEWRLEGYRRSAENLGCDWEDYKQLNQIVE